jgi:hypothetical protein
MFPARWPKEKAMNRVLSIAVSLTVMFTVLPACGGAPDEVTLATPTLPTSADGQSPAPVTATISEGGVPIARGTFTFNATLGSFAPMNPGCPSVTSSTTANVVGGVATINLYSTTAGEAQVTAEWADDLTTATAMATTGVVFDQ